MLTTLRPVIYRRTLGLPRLSNSDLTVDAPVCKRAQHSMLQWPGFGNDRVGYQRFLCAYQGTAVEDVNQKCRCDELQKQLAGVVSKAVFVSQEVVCGHG